MTAKLYALVIYFAGIVLYRQTSCISLETAFYPWISMIRTGPAGSMWGLKKDQFSPHLNLVRLLGGMK